MDYVHKQAKLGKPWNPPDGAEGHSYWNDTFHINSQLSGDELKDGWTCLLQLSLGPPVIQTKVQDCVGIKLNASAEINRSKNCMCCQMGGGLVYWATSNSCSYI